MAQKYDQLQETVFSDKPTVDREAGVIRNVKILGNASKNGREYSEGAKKDAAKIYEGLGVNLNHPDRGDKRDRDVEDGCGWLESVHVEPDGVYGDLHYFKTHPQASLIAEAAERKPDRFGLSHNADGRVVRQGNKNVVESIVSVKSVDIVQNPATNKSFFESEDLVNTTVKKILESHVKADRRSRLVKLFEDDAMLPMGDTPVDVASDSSPDDQVDAAFEAMVVAVLQDDSLDLAAKKKKIGDILTAQEKLTGDPAASTETNTEGDPTMPESRTPQKHSDPTVIALREELNNLRQKDRERDAREAQQIAVSEARHILESANVEPTEIRINAVVATPKQNRTELVETFEKRKKSRPERSAPLYESTGPETMNFPKDTASFVAALR